MKKILASMKIKIAIALTVVTVASGAVIINVTKKKEEPPRLIATDVIKDLPTNVGPDNSVMYDFIYSMVGYKMDVDINDYGSLYAIMVNDDSLKSKSADMFVSFYTSVDMYPSLGTNIQKVVLSDASLEAVKSSLKNWDDKQLKFNAKDGWTLYLITQSFDGKSSDFTYTSDTKGNYWNNINLNLDFDLGQYARNLRNGWDTDWIRREPFASQIKYNRNTDINDPFYDKFKLDEIIDVKEIDSTVTRQIQVVGVNKFKTITGMTWNMDFQQMNVQLESEGFEQIPNR